MDTQRNPGSASRPAEPPHQSRPVVVTRAESAEGALSSHLRALGLQVLNWPAVSVAVAETSALEAALERIGEFDWVVFASRHAVAAVTERLARAPRGLRVAAVGQATAQVLRQRGWPVDLIPDEANASSLVSAFAGRAHSLAGISILFPASSRALPTIAAGLRQLGATVVQAEAYRTEPAALDVESCTAWIEREAIGAVTFASPSAVIELERLLGRVSFGRLSSSAHVVAIGPTTARELAERGCSAVVAESATLRGLAATVGRLLQTSSARQ